MTKTVARRDPRDMTIGGFTLTERGLTIEGEPTFDEWQMAGQYLERVGSGVQWWIGDWLNYGDGRPQWGDKYEQAISLFNVPYDTLATWKAVSANIEFRKRLRNLSWSHHQAVAYCDTEEIPRLLELAAPAADDLQPRLSVAELKRVVRQEKLAIGRAEKHLPVGTYDLIYADPPWRYEHSKTDNRKIENHYPTMDLDEICALPIAPMCADDCVMFMWATSPKLAESMQVVEAWGFTYRTCMVWVKDRIGMGYYARQKHELLLICVKGTPPVPEESTRPPSVIEAKREEHSRKPVEFYEAIEEMYPYSTKVELFCRVPRKGWSVWGNEV